jgi:hypothetical protein
MFQLRYICFLSISILLLSSCEDVIQLDLESTESRIVIEATINASSQTATVLISKTNDFYDNTEPEQVSGAIITLQSETGDTYTFSEASPGTYVAENVIANPEEVFNLNVEVEDRVYEATATVPSAANLKEITQSDFPSGPFGDEGAILLSAIWDDPAGTENFYRIRTYIDNTFQADSYTVLTDDIRGDGEEITTPIQKGFDENTTVTVELLSTDEAYYDYFFQVASLSGEGANSTTPYNPTGNFSNEALGYFGIFHSSTLSIEL